MDNTKYIEHVKELMKYYDYEVKHAEVVGSTYIAGKEDRDIDVLLLVKADRNVEEMGFDGWAYGGSVGEGNDSHWGSWKKTFEGRDLNMLITTDETYFNAWLTAAEVCRYLHCKTNSYVDGVKPVIREADVRIAIHNIIMDDSTANEELNNEVVDYLVKKGVQ